MKVLLALFLLGISHQNLVAASCDTPIDCYEKALVALNEAKTKIEIYDSRIQTSQTTADKALTAANKSQNTANSAQSTASAAKKTADSNSGKTCYLTSSAHGNRWGTCKYGGIYRGGQKVAGSFAGISAENVWKGGDHMWLCCN